MTKLQRRSFFAMALGCAVASPLTPRSASAAPTTPTVTPSFFFRDGDNAMILGDSITQQFQYSNLMESYVYSRFPNWKITFRNSGWGGDTMNLRQRGGLESGFARDIAPLKPSAVTIDFGMNDARAQDGGYEGYVSSARTLVDKFRSLGTRITLVAPSAEERYEAGQPAGSVYNLMLRKYAEGLKGVAQEKKVPYVDQLNPMIQVIESGRTSGVLTADDKVRLIPDGVHPNWAGHLVMATYILKGLNAPSLVSSVEIDAAKSKAKAEKAQASQINSYENLEFEIVQAAGKTRFVQVSNGSTLSFVRQDEAMPWPVPKEVAVALKIPGFNPMDDLSRYMLKVTKLTAPKYSVAIDDKEIGTYTREELAAGVNLSFPALEAMPETGKLLGDIHTQTRIFFNRWRNVQLGAPPKADTPEAAEAARQEELKKQDALLAEMDAKLNQPRTPPAHRWTLLPVN